MTNNDLPSTAELFYDSLSLYVPKAIDVRVSVNNVKSSWSGGLDTLAKELGVERFAGK